jgi:hypothetical protein
MYIDWEIGIQQWCRSQVMLPVAWLGTDQEGGCYAASGPVAIQWHKTSKTGAINDAETLTAFARSLPVGAFLRHHVAGDIGAEK